MPEIVEPDPPEPRLREDLVEYPTLEVRLVQRRPCVRTEGPHRNGRPATPKRLRLPGAEEVTKSGRKLVGEINTPDLPILGRENAATVLHGAAYLGEVALELNVAPLEAEQLAETHPGAHSAQE